ncbi:MAG: ABC transporter substrate-binding protein [Chloroflexi bacterium]|nr:ABC transporter substrate-binding protein [Chloroflexota bacterium]
MDVAFNGLAYVGPNMPWPFAVEAKPTLKDLGPWFQYDPKKAKALLAEAGYPNGFTTSMIMYQYSAANKDISEMAADMLREVGVTVKVQDLDYTSYNSQWVGRKLEEMANGWGTVGFDADGFAYNQLHSKSLGNRSFVNDPMIDDLAIKQRAEVDPAKRKALIKQIWDRQLDQMFNINVPTGNTFDVQQPYVRGLRFSSWVSSYYAWGMMDNIWLDK